MSDSHEQAARPDPVYDRLAARPEFSELRSRYRAFVIPATAAFLAWYALYVVMAMFAPGIMNRDVIGTINVALVIGLLQFVTTFLLAYIYSRYSSQRLDPLAEKLNEEFAAAQRGGNEPKERD